MEGIELICFQIISNVGGARSSYIEAIHKAKNGDFESASQSMQEGAEMFLEGHNAHAKLVQKEAAGEDTKLSLLLVHAEDQLMSAEGFGILAQEFIDLYKVVKA